MRNVSEKNTKAEILSAYNQALEIIQNNKTEMSKENIQSNKNESAKMVATAVAERAELTEEAIREKFESFVSQYNEIAEQIKAMDQAVELKKQEVADTLKLEDTALQLDVLIKAIEIKKEEMKAIETEYSEKLAEAKATLAQAKNELSESAARDIDEIKYSTKIEIQRLKEEKNYELATFKKEIEKQREDAQASLDKIEEMLEEKSQFISSLENKIEEAEAEKERAIKAEVAKVSAVIKKEYETEARFKELENKSTIEALNSAISSLKAEITKIEIEKENAIKDRNAAMEKMQEIASKAIDGKGAAQALEAALQMGQNTKTGK